MRTDSKALYLVGAPASGKSTTMAAIRELLEVHTGEAETLWPGFHGIFKGEPLWSTVDGGYRGVSLGVNREGGFPGTDGLSMCAPPVAIEWANEADLPPLIVGEGNRLSTDGFMAALARNTDFVVAYLAVPDEDLDRRCEQRGSNQNPRWRKSAATRASRAVVAASDAGARVVRCDPVTDPPLEVARKILKELL